MSNPLFDQLNGRAVNNTPQMGGAKNPLSNMQNFLHRFDQFRNTFTGDPKQQVEQLLRTGQMSQEQFNQFQQAARQIEGMFAGRR
jgi:hypothetical protein